MESTERRSSPRQPIKLAAQLDLGRGESWPCQIADFCAEGLFVRFSPGISRKLDAVLDEAPTQNVLVRFRGADQSGVPGQRYQLQVKIRRRIEGAMGVCFTEANPLAVSAMLQQCGGARATGHAHLRAPSERVQFVLHQCAKAVVQFIEPMMQNCLQHTVAALQKRANQAGNNQLANELMDASGQLNSRQLSVCQQVSRRLESPLKPASRESGTSALAVVDKSEFEEWLSLRVMITKADTLYRGLLLQLKLRLDNLGIANATGHTNPLGPALICEAFRSGLAALSMSREVEKVAFGVFEHSVLRQLEPLYIELNNILIRQGVLPDLDLTKYLTDKQRSESQSAPVKTPPTETPPIQTPPTETSRAASEADDGVEVSQASAARPQPARIKPERGRPPAPPREAATPADEFQGHAQAARNAIATVRSLLNTLANSRAGASQPQADEFPADAPALSNAQLQQKLQQLQTVAPMPDDTEASLRERVVGKVLNDSDGRLDDAQQSAVDVVDRFFQSLRESPKLDESTHRYLRQLEVPVLKVVMRDPDFFEDMDSPVRSVLNRLAHLGGRGRKVNPIIKRRVEELIQSIVTTFEHDLGVFERVSDELEELIERQKRVYQRNVERVKAAAEGAQKVAESKQAVEDALQQRLAGKKVPKALDSLLSGGWRDLLSLTWIRHGPDSQPWQDYLGAVDSLVLFAEDPHSSVNLPELLRIIQNGLTSVSGSNLPTAGIRDELRRFLVRDAASAPELVLVPAAPAPQARLRTLPEQEQRWRKRVRDLLTGDWLRDQHQPDQPFYIRLVWIARDYERLVFVNHQGMRMVELELDALAEKMRKGQIVTDPQYHRPLVDEGLDRMVRKVYDQLARAASQDELTGLLERREFERQLEQQLANWKSPRSLLRFELRNFSKFADSAGDEAGHEVLKRVAGILRAELVKDTPMTRLATADFALLMTAGSDPTLANKLVRRISAEVFQLNGKAFTLELGAVMVPQSESLLSSERWLQAAEQSLRLNRQDGLTYYSLPPEQQLQQQQIAKKMSDLKGALQERLLMRCHKILPLHPETRVLVQYDVLTSMYDDDDKLVAGKELMRLAERYGQVQALDRWVVGTMLDWLERKSEKLTPYGGVCIGLSGHSLNDSALLEFIYEKLSERKSPIERLSFEITEAAAISDVPALAAFIREMQELGCRFCLAGVGNGSESFHALRSLPVDMLKIDSALTANLLESESDQSMLRSMVEMAHYLGREVIVTQVGSREMLTLLVQMGIDYAQGNAIEKPCLLDSLV